MFSDLLLHRLQLLLLLPMLSIVFFSGYAADASLEAIFPHGGPTLIPKPFTEEQLARTAREALDRRRMVSLELERAGQQDLPRS